MAIKNGTYKVWNGTSWDTIKLLAYNADKLGGQLPSYYAVASHSHAWNSITSKPTFSTVATSGSYNDLSNKPSIPTVPVISTNILADATSDVKTVSPKAVKIYADNLVTNLGKIKIGDTWYTATLSGTTLTLY